jgi:pimeloyl-ACP methyl ester carboxylesterase
MADEIEFRHRAVVVGDSTLHVVEAGDPDGPPVLFLHGWPQSGQAWHAVMAAAPPSVRTVAIDLPGVGESTGDPTDGSKAALAAVVHDLIGTLGLRDPILAGHDAGGMVAWSYLRTYDDVAGVVIMDTVIPGVDPWDQVLANPYVWHFALHAVPELPETLVQGRQRAYFDYFFDVLTPDPARISEATRQAAVAAYASDAALTAGFSWYRTLPADAKANAAATTPVETPLLYVRGAGEMGDIEQYAAAFRAAGVRNVRTATIPGAGHFTAEEDPAAVWSVIDAFRR